MRVPQTRIQGLSGRTICVCAAIRSHLPKWSTSGSLYNLVHKASPQLYLGNVPLLYTSTQHPGTVYRAFPALVRQATNAGLRRLSTRLAAEHVQLRGPKLSLITKYRSIMAMHKPSQWQEFAFGFISDKRRACVHCGQRFGHEVVLNYSFTVDFFL